MSDVKAVRPVRRDELRKFKNVCVVFGSRQYKDDSTFEACLLGFIKDKNLKKEDTVFVSGMAPNGPDEQIVRWCKAKGWRWHECPAKWDDITVQGARIKTRPNGDQYNVLAGFMRNQEMANVSNFGLGFWDGHSPGTKDMVDRCNDRDNLKLRIIRVKEQDA